MNKLSNKPFLRIQTNTKLDILTQAHRQWRCTFNSFHAHCCQCHHSDFTPKGNCEQQPLWLDSCKQHKCFVSLPNYYIRGYAEPQLQFLPQYVHQYIPRCLFSNFLILYICQYTSVLRVFPKVKGLYSVQVRSFIQFSNLSKLNDVCLITITQRSIVKIK